LTEKYKLIPEELNFLKELEELIGTEIPYKDEIEWETVGVKIYNNRIGEIGLFDCGLKNLPLSIGNLKSLEILRVNRNQLSTLPKSIGNLKKLKTLILSDNILDFLPDSLGNLVLLENLNLEDNQLNILPEIVTKLTSLQKLNLGWNKLTTLPESFCQLVNLKKVVFNGNNWKEEWKDVEKNNLLTIFELCRKLNGINIFISHAMEDQEQYNIIDLKYNLETREKIHEVHVCEVTLVGDIQKFMTENVPKTDLLIFITTKNSLASNDCLYELSLAKKYDVKILLIKGLDIQKRSGLAQVDLRKFGQGIIDLNTLDSLYFNTDNFTIFVDHLYTYIEKHEFELKLHRKIQSNLEKEVLNIKGAIFDIIESEEFIECFKKKNEEFNLIFQDLRNNKITEREFISKIALIINQRIKN